MRERAYVRAAGAQRRNPAKEKEEKSKPAPEREDYDGYYDDVLPEDADTQRGGVDKGLVKRILLLTLMVAVVIAGCVVALYLL